MDVLSPALAAAEPEGYIRSFVDEGDGLRLLLTNLRTEKRLAPGLAAYHERLLDAFPVVDHQAPPRILTPRELEILQRLAAGLSYAEISERLIITENTLKFHVKSIYSKLNVRNRTQAVLRAQEKQLL